MKIDKIFYLYVLIVFLGWGLAVFFDKLAADKLGDRAIIPALVAEAFAIMILGVFYLFANHLNLEREGIIWLILSFFFNFITIIFYYLLFSKTEVTWASPITALYPIVPIALGFIVLHESITFMKMIGITLSLLAIVFLSI